MNFKHLHYFWAATKAGGIVRAGQQLHTYGVEVLGRAPELVEEFFAVSPERRITHPCVAAITHAARVTFLSK